MTVVALPSRALQAPRRLSPTLWGLSTAQLHDAYWASRGVQCVRRGAATALDRAADLYLLLEPGQLILFDLGAITDRLTWHDAAVTRLRLRDEHPQPYRERVVCDEQGLVQRIERRYRGSSYGAHRVVLTTRRATASLWLVAISPHGGWQAVRRSVPWSRVDHWKLPGTAVQAGDRAQERRFLSMLLERWPTPDQSIEGICSTQSGVWHLEGETLAPATIRVGPLWLGHGAAGDERRCLLGPACIADAAAPESAARLRRIADVTPPETSLNGPAARSRGQVYPAAKRAIDIVVSLIGLLGLLPVLGLVALLVLLEDGRPILFGHLRQGRHGRPFRCWKFRTMHRDAERLTRELEAYNVCDGPQVYIPDDPRVTRIGRLLRSTHLDELPQLWNVLAGRMSLVGPRPSPDAENQYCPAWRDARLSVRPGITGLWQVQRRREPGEDFQEWIRYDIEYVHSASFALDLHIMLRTLKLMVLGRDDRESQQAR